MNTIIGQSKLVEKLKTYNCQNFPSALMLLGEAGSGKKYIASRLAKHLGVDLVELLPQDWTTQWIEYTQCPITKLYLLDLSSVQEKQQTKFLKLIEEPPATMKLLITAESEIGILATILNRCLKYTLESYSVEELKQFSWAPKDPTDIVYKVCNTPGQLLNVSNTEVITRLSTMCEAFIEQVPKMPEAGYANMLSICTKINYKEDFSKFDFNLFFNVLAYTAFENFKMTKNIASFELYKLVVAKKIDMLNKVVSKESFMLSFLEDAWRLTHK